VSNFPRSTPLNSKTMWTIYVGGVQLSALGHHVLLTMGPAVPTTFLLTLAILIFLLGAIGVLGISVVDRAVILGLGWINDQRPSDRNSQESTRGEGGDRKE
jgi:hypothetical protein